MSVTSEKLVEVKVQEVIGREVGHVDRGCLVKDLLDLLLADMRARASLVSGCHLGELFN